MLHTVLKTLAAMPYSEMMALASYIGQEIEFLTKTGGFDQLSAEQIASILAKAAERNTELAEASIQEEQIVRKVFARKRVITVAPYGTKGYAIEVNSVPGTMVTGNDLRAMLGQMLDQAITVHALGVMGK